MNLDLPIYNLPSVEILRFAQNDKKMKMHTELQAGCLRSQGLFSSRYERWRCLRISVYWETRNMV